MTRAARVRERLADLRNSIREQLAARFDMWIATQSHSS